MFRLANKGLLQCLPHGTMALLWTHAKHLAFEYADNHPRDGWLHCFLGHLRPLPLHPAGAIQEALLLVQFGLWHCYDLHDDLGAVRREGCGTGVLQRPERPRDLTVERFLDHHGWAEPGHRPKGRWHDQRERFLSVFWELLCFRYRNGFLPMDCRHPRLPWWLGDHGGVSGHLREDLVESTRPDDGHDGP